jgi:WD40 repeat protein
MPEKRDIFVSYSRANTEFARDLYAKLQSLGFTLWRDRSDMEGGADWWRQIQEAIENVDTMILILSPTALASEVVAQEWHYARQKGTRVIPVLAQSVDWNAVPRWMKRVDWLDLRPEAQELDLTWNRLIEQLRTPYQPRCVPFPEAEKLPADFVARPGVFEPLLRALVDETHGAVAISAALRGAGGYGKTTLARALIHDVRVRGAFDDGILWITLDEKPESLLGKLQDLYVKLTDKVCPYQTLEGTRDALAELLKDRYVLIVIDDVWNADHLKPFLVGGKHCAHLITTRYSEALPEEVTFRVPVDAMQPQEAAQLLASGFSEAAQTRHAQAFAELAKRLFYWALLLKLANGVLRDYGENALQTALRDLNELLDQAGISGLDDSQRVAKMLEATFGRLKPEEVERFRDLRVFPEDVRVPVAAIERLWRATGGLAPIFCRRLLDRFERLSLLLEYDHAAETVRLHDAIRTAALAYRPADLPSMHEEFLRAYAVQRWADLPSDEPYLWDHLAYHLLEAGKRDELRAALLDYRYLRAKLAARSVNALLSDFDACLSGGEDRPIRLVRQALELSADRLAESAEGLDCYLYGRLYSHRDLPEIGALRQQTEPKGWQPMHEPTHHQAGGHLLRTLRGHEGAVEGALELRDGRLLSWAWDKTLRLWAADGAPLATLRGHEGWVLGALELRDGRLLSWSWDETLRLWAADGAPLATLRGHEEEVSGALELRDGRLLSWSKDKTLRLWAADGAPLATLRGHEGGLLGGVLGALELRDGRLLSWSGDATLRLWAADGAPLATLRGHEYGVLGALELRDGRLLSWSWDKTLRLWAADGAPLATLRGHEGGVLGALALRDGRLLSWSQDWTLRLWAADGAPLATLRGHEGGVLGALALRDGRLLSWALDATLRLWAADGAPIDTIREDASVRALRAWFAQHNALEDGFKQLMRAWHGSSFAPEINGLLRREGNVLRLYNVETDEILASFHAESEIRGATFLQNGEVVALWCENGQVIFLRVLR